MAFPFHIQEHVLDGAHMREYACATANSQEDILSLHVKQYTPIDNPHPQKGDITVIGAHANGFPKEMYEPLWTELYHQLKQSGVRIRSICTIDAAWQGQSGLLNSGKLGNDPSWLDYSRDIYQVIGALRLPQPLVAVGHSFGGAALVNTSLMNPRLFTSIILLDPVIEAINGPSSKTLVNKRSPVALSVFRRDTWPSRAEAEKSFSKNVFYQSWDPRALQLWLQYGLTDTQDGKVALTTSKHQEVRTFVRSSSKAFNADGSKIIDPRRIPDADPNDPQTQIAWPVYRPESSTTWDHLPRVRPTVLYIFGGQSNIGDTASRNKKVFRTGAGVGGSGGITFGKVKQVVGEECGHLIPMENPKLCADAAASWIVQHLPSWQAEDAEFQEFAKQPAQVKSFMGQDIFDFFSKTRQSKL